MRHVLVEGVPPFRSNQPYRVVGPVAGSNLLVVRFDGWQHYLVPSNKVTDYVAG
jgi:hypothetical protein